LDFYTVQLLIRRKRDEPIKSARRAICKLYLPPIVGEKLKMNDLDFIERNREVTEQFRANGGQVPGWGAILLLTIKGAKTGQPHVYPLMSVPYGDAYLAVASKGGAPKHPVWYYNLVANPDVTVEVGNEKFEATARMLSGEERAKAFVKAVEVFPNYAQYQTKTDREIPIFLLERRVNA
jgi:deazaflavin-dependent oxidoreductase (nitroreductase family)